MCGVRCYIFIICLLPLFSINTDAFSIIDKSSERLSDLMHDKFKHPLIILVNTDNVPNIPDFDEVSKEAESSYDDYVDGQVKGRVKYEREETVQKQAVSMLKDIIQSADNEAEDPSLMKSKHVLRQALRYRCQKVDKCIQKCPSKKQKCEVSCQKKFDDQNLCEEPTTTRRPKNCATGRTMPPSWRF